MTRTVLGDADSRCRLYLTAKPSYVGVNVDGIACLLHRPTVCNHQTRGHGFLSGTTLSHRATICSGAFSGM
jgi:hypothetical protein